jgi:HD-GYP domain-containing protein (c-di-GMP phosphodiesterase class II)
LADVYDALTSDRPYRKALHPFNALKLMEKEMVGNFQRELFKEFVLLFK